MDSNVTLENLKEAVYGAAESARDGDTNALKAYAESAEEALRALDAHGFQHDTSPLGPYPGATPYSREERLSRAELWRRYRVVIEALRVFVDHAPAEPETWSDQLALILMGPEAAGDPRITGSLADPCDANFLVYEVDDGSRELLDVHPCVLKRGHGGMHCDQFGSLFNTGDIQEQNLRIGD